MQFIQGNNRHQTFFNTLEDQVAADNPVMLIDAFIDKPGLKKTYFTVTSQSLQLLIITLYKKTVAGRGHCKMNYCK